jgi:hypothetical protein
MSPNIWLARLSASAHASFCLNGGADIAANYIEDASANRRLIRCPLRTRRVRRSRRSDSRIDVRPTKSACATIGSLGLQVQCIKSYSSA